MPVVIKYFLSFSRSQKYATRSLRSLLSYFYDLSNSRKYFIHHRHNILVFCRYQLTYSDLAELVVAQLPREEDIKIAAQCKEDILLSSLARSVTLTWPMFSLDLKKSQLLVYILKIQLSVFCILHNGHVEFWKKYDQFAHNFKKNNSCLFTTLRKISSDCLQL